MARKTLGRKKKLGRAKRIGSADDSLKVLALDIGQFGFIVSMAGPGGGGRTVLKADNPSQAFVKAAFRTFGGRRVPVGTESIISQTTGPGTARGKAKQKTFLVESSLIDVDTGRRPPPPKFKVR